MSGAPRITVLLYHEIAAHGDGAPDCVPRAVFEEHVAALSDAGFHFVPLAEAFRLATAGAAAGAAPAVAFTFDDGYAGLAQALPAHAAVLQPTLFLVPRYLGGSNLAWNLRATTILQHLTLAQTEALAAAGVRLEAHGMDHHNLLKFSAADLQERFAEVRAWFAETWGRAPAYLAYPYGACDATVQRVAAQHFAGAVSVNHGVWDGPAARFALNRISVPFYLSGADLLAVIAAAPEERWRVIEERAPWRR